MIKKLDKLIIKSFLGPFIITFFIAFFVLMMQILWKYIDDLVGKGLDFITIGKFLWYASATLLTLAMPIAILISSIMTFGNLGESFELVAIKSAGISLLRFMRPLVWIAILASGITFMFANYVIPYANLQFATLYNDIFYKKPAFELKEGVFFTDIPGYAIKVGKKDDDGRTLHNVLIYEQANMIQENTIIAESGVMKVSKDNNFLEFNLQNGFRYQERGNLGDSATEFIRLGFKSFKKLFDLRVLQKQNTNDSIYRNNYKMLSVRQIGRALDSLQKMSDSSFKRLNTEFGIYMPYGDVPDSIWNKLPADTVQKGKIVNIIPDSSLIIVHDAAVAIADNMKSIITNIGEENERRGDDIRFHKIEWHKKFAVSMACLVLFFIGAPLGSIIRKGGLGMPLVVAIIFFLLFHLLNMFGEKFVKEGLTTPFIGMWLAVLVLTPVGIFLTYKAMHDSQLFSKEFYYRTFNQVQKLFVKFKVKKSESV